jgi:hypothetical protein
MRRSIISLGVIALLVILTVVVGSAMRSQASNAQPQQFSVQQTYNEPPIWTDGREDPKPTDRVIPYCLRGDQKGTADIYVVIDSVGFWAANVNIANVVAAGSVTVNTGGLGYGNIVVTHLQNNKFLVQWISPAWNADGTGVFDHTFSCNS